MALDPKLGVDAEEPLRLIEEHRQLVQKWFDQGASLNGILWTIGSALVAILKQCGAPAHKVERLRTDILLWMNSTQTMKQAMGPRNRAERRAEKAKTRH